MNRLESLIYQAVKRNPKIKNLVRDAYQALFSMVPIPREHAEYPVTVREGFFFGFHDKKPWSADNLYLLTHGCQGLPNREPVAGDRVEIGFFTGDNYSDYQKITSTACFNWQQGSALQWLGKSNRFIFNDSGGVDNSARIFDTDGRSENVLPKAIAAVNPEGTKALSYNFARLQRHFPGYGYAHGSDPEIEKEAPISHGISIIDIQSNIATGLFTVYDVASYQPEKSMAGAKHFLTHCLFSPSGRRFLFLHRWIRNDNFTYTRMLSCDVNGQQLHLFPTSEMVSHIAWQDEDHVLAYCRSKEGRDAYILFRDLTEEHRLIGTGDFNSDGHPSFPVNSKEWFITDTYPDRFRRSYLILYNMQKELRSDLGYFRQPLSFKEAIRCDLHPRWNNDGTMICFDSAHTGKRSLCTMNIGNLTGTGKLNSH
ncbi:MAG: hypothetical protein ACOYNC_17110 [Bacteroidales bacterium]